MVVDFTTQFVNLEAGNACLREAAKSSSDQLERANKLAAQAQGEAEFEERTGSVEGEDRGGGTTEDRGSYPRK
jgi:hypothetical protein